MSTLAMFLLKLSETYSCNLKVSTRRSIALSELLIVFHIKFINTVLAHLDARERSYTYKQ